ncbi:MAG: putative sulfate exporter family transporter [Sporocytophaga sp.]|uniref:YeiH family protein n=1 Tax=Sporocytophaga sp. TaxID=2231183 RepID=UPI001B0541C3|nr:putative sulfate exporter family transporter [Sporocytophaga sp.]MBO9700096.1 putative sulfate exporter family transporter [Sporocytophaga sp.]
MSKISTVNSATQPKRNIVLHEDWAVVLLGFIIITILLSGFSIASPSYNWNNGHEFGDKVLESSNLIKILNQFLVTIIIALIGVYLTNKSIKSLLLAFPGIYLLSVFALILAGNSQMKSLNLEAVIFSLGIGLLVSNLINLPQWFRSILSTELFVKIGLVLLGTGVIFGDILKAGGLGLIQALVVVVSVWYFAFWICKKLKLDEELSLMISSAVSICGVSAAIATAGAIKGDSKKLSYVISLVLITAIPMMIVMPYMANYMGLSQEVTGAWLGGSIDTTGAVVASDSLVGETALKISTIVKFSQNVLLGVAAFVISIYWTYSNNPQSARRNEKQTLAVIWERFPKFVLGFIAASLIFSFLLNTQATNAVKDSMKSMQTLWFVLAFTSIGLETKFSDLINQSNRKPMYAFVIAQAFNIVITLIIALLLFK